MSGPCRRVFYVVVSNRSRCSTIRVAAWPSHLGGMAPFFYWPAMSGVSAERDSFGLAEQKESVAGIASASVSVSRGDSVHFLEIWLAENTYDIDPRPGAFEYDTIVPCSQPVQVLLEAL